MSLLPVTETDRGSFHWSSYSLLFERFSSVSVSGVDVGVNTDLNIIFSLAALKLICEPPRALARQWHYRVQSQPNLQTLFANITFYGN